MKREVGSMRSTLLLASHLAAAGKRSIGQRHQDRRAERPVGHLCRPGRPGLGRRRAHGGRGFRRREKGMKVEIVVADHQNKPDVGSSIARQWYDVGQGRRDRRRADLLGRARGQPDRQGKEQGAARLDRRDLRSHRQGVHAQHDPLDLRHLGARQRHRQRDREDRRRHLVLPHGGLRVRARARARHRGGGAEERRQGARQGAPSAQRRRTSRRSCCRRRRPRRRSSAWRTPAATPSTRSSRAPNSASSRAGRSSRACSCSSPTCTRSASRRRRACCSPKRSTGT